MNSWPFHEIKRQIEYKAAWEGVPVITLTVGSEGNHDGLSTMRGETKCQSEAIRATIANCGAISAIDGETAISSQCSISLAGGG
jgi:hypothetical protein